MILRFINWWKNYTSLEYDVLFGGYHGRKCLNDQHEFPIYITYNGSRGAKPSDRCQCNLQNFKDHCDIEMEEMRKVMYGEN